MPNKAKFALLAAMVFEGLGSTTASADIYQNIDYGMEVPIPAVWADWKGKWCMNKAPAPNHGFAVTFQGQDCDDENLFDKPRIEFFVEYNTAVEASRPEELIDTYCEKAGGKRTRYFSGKTPIYECNDIHEKNGLTAKTYFLLRKNPHHGDEIVDSEIVSTFYYWKKNNKNPAYRQQALDLLINIHWIGDFAEDPK